MVHFPIIVILLEHFSQFWYREGILVAPQQVPILPWRFAYNVYIIAESLKDFADVAQMI